MQTAWTYFSMQSELLLWLPASGRLGDDSYAVTRSSVTARCCHRHCVAASAALQACSVVQVLHLSECEICVSLIWVHVYWPPPLVLLFVAFVHVCVGVDVLMRRCYLWAWKPAMSVVACVTLTASPFGQELLSYAAWFLSVLCKSHIPAENHGKVDLVCWWHLLFLCLDSPWRADCPLLTAHNCRETTS